MLALAEIYSYIPVRMCMTAHGVTQMFSLLDISFPHSRDGYGAQHIGLSHSSLCAGTKSGTSSDVKFSAAVFVRQCFELPPSSLSAKGQRHSLLSSDVMRENTNYCEACRYLDHGAMQLP